MYRREEGNTSKCFGGGGFPSNVLRCSYNEGEKLKIKPASRLAVCSLYFSITAVCITPNMGTFQTDGGTLSLL